MCRRFWCSQRKESHRLKFPIGEDAKFNWQSLADFKAAHGDLSGQTLTIFGPWRGEDDTLIRSVLAYFTDATGVTVQYSSSENYEQQVVIDTQAGSPADITVLPQPGLIADLASKGFLVPLAKYQKWFSQLRRGESWVALGNYKAGRNSGLYGFPTTRCESLVW